MKEQKSFVTNFAACPSVLTRAAAAEWLGEDHRVGRRFLAALFLVAAVEGPTTHAPILARYTGITRRRCIWFGIEARRQGIFRKGLVQVERWVSPPEHQGMGKLQFILDCMTLAGEVYCRRGKYSLPVKVDYSRMFNEAL